MKRLLPLVLVLCSAPACAQKALSVHVVDATGTPIKGAQVQVEVTSEVDAPRLPPQITNASGNALFSLFFVSATESPHLRIIAGAKGFAFNSALIIKGEVKPEVRLERGAPWRGKVVDEAGQPVAGAIVALSGTVRDHGYDRAIFLPDGGSPLSALYATSSNSDGTFVIDNAPTGSTLSFRAKSAGRALVEGSEARVGENEYIQLVRAGTLHGRVLDPDGKPIAHLGVYAGPNTGTVGNAATTNAQGAFTIGNLAPGVYSVNVATSLNAPKPYVLSGQNSVRVAAGKTRELGLWRARRGVLIRGIVRDATTKKPMARALVVVESRVSASTRAYTWSRSDTAGHFAIRVLPGTYRVGASVTFSGNVSSIEWRQVTVDASGKQGGTQLCFLLGRVPNPRRVP